VSDATLPSPDGSRPATPHRRRPRYSGKHPRRFEEKYKERDPQRYADTVAKVLASGKTPAGTHRPIMVAEILETLAPKPGELAVDCTLGYGGHAREILARLQPGGRLLGLDADPVELPKTEARLRAAGFGPEVFTAIRSNFAGLPQALASHSERGCGRRPSRSRLEMTNVLRLMLRTQPRSNRRKAQTKDNEPARTASLPTLAFHPCNWMIRRAASP